MNVSILNVTDNEVEPLRELQRQETPLAALLSSGEHQGYFQTYLITLGGAHAAYGTVGHDDRWHRAPTVFELYIRPEFRAFGETIFADFTASTNASAFEFQTSDAGLSAILSSWCGEAVVDKIIFSDSLTTFLPGYGTIIHQFWPSDVAKVFQHHSQPVGDWVLEFDGKIAGTGGMKHRYQPPYVDLFAEINPRYRQRGLGSYLIQELKRLCYDLGLKPCARCSPDDLPAIRTIERAGFTPCAHVLSGQLLAQIA
ncbi:MAG: GNAT family N-acetyltransferase [Nibricoccus sp.]